MYTFWDYLTESSNNDKLLHLEHIEDDVLNSGIKGLQRSYSILKGLGLMLQSHVKSNLKITTKFDGAPSLVAGINPDNGKFFVATKSAFNVNPKLNYTEKDIAMNHPNEGLARTLQLALKYLPELGIKGVIQGDLMFTNDTLKKMKIGEHSFLTFQPNTILYAVPLESDISKHMQAAKLGIVIHTQYTGKTFDSLMKSFDVDVNSFKRTKNVWFRDASIADVSGTVNFTDTEFKEYSQKLERINALSRSLSRDALAKISNSEPMKIEIKTFYNSKIRSGVGIVDSHKHVIEFLSWINDKENKNILSSKRADTRHNREIQKNKKLAQYKSLSSQLKAIFDVQNAIIDAKLVVLRKLENIKDLHLFIQDSGGYRVTKPEGFVATDHIGNAVKLVDRLEFSAANFNKWKK